MNTQIRPFFTVHTVTAFISGAALMSVAGIAVYSLHVGAETRMAFSESEFSFETRPYLCEAVTSEE